MSIIADANTVIDTYWKVFTDLEFDPIAVVVHCQSPDRDTPSSSSVAGADKDVLVKKVQGWFQMQQQQKKGPRSPPLPATFLLK